jgi:hypothetical protein
VRRGRQGLLGDELESVADPVAEQSADDGPDLGCRRNRGAGTGGVETLDAACAPVDCVELILAEYGANRCEPCRYIGPAGYHDHATIPVIVGILTTAGA